MIRFIKIVKNIFLLLKPNENRKKYEKKTSTKKTQLVHDHIKSFPALDS